MLICYVCAGVQERGGRKRDCFGPAEGHTLSEGGDWSRGLPLLLGHCLPQRLGEYVFQFYISISKQTWMSKTATL